MKFGFFVFTILGFLLFEFAESQAQSLIIKLKDGSENTSAVNDIQNLSFSLPDLLVNLRDGAVNPYALSTIRKLTFDLTTSVVQPIVPNTSTLIIYPNPATEILNLDGIPGDVEHVSIFRSDGCLALTEKVNSGKSTINISSLRPGLYFLSVQGQSSKFIKQ